jgi:hypothetical protein
MSPMAREPVGIGTAISPSWSTSTWFNVGGSHTVLNRQLKCTSIRRFFPILSQHAMQNTYSVVIWNWSISFIFHICHSVVAVINFTTNGHSYQLWGSILFSLSKITAALSKHRTILISKRDSDFSNNWTKIVIQAGNKRAQHIGLYCCGRNMYGLVILYEDRSELLWCCSFSHPVT